MFAFTRQFEHLFTDVNYYRRVSVNFFVIVGILNLVCSDLFGFAWMCITVCCCIYSEIV